LIERLQVGRLLPDSFSLQEQPHSRTSAVSGLLHLRKYSVHVWQHQSGIFLPLRRLPWARYDYRFTPGRPLARYGIEQQAMLVQHAFMMRRGAAIPEAPPLAPIEAILPF